MAGSDISNLIRMDREVRKNKNFEGTFLDYIDRVSENTDIAMLAHQRMHDIITFPGVEVIKTDENPRLRRIYGNDTIKKYKFFSDDFFGIDKTIMKLVRYFHSAAMAGEEARQVLYLVGPVGAGKSSLMESLKRALE
jgi:serine protein kinase